MGTETSIHGEAPMHKLKLSLEDLTVITFAAEAKREEANGTVLANSETAQRVCYTPVYDCYTVRWICYTQPEGGCA
jgi:hypothetical protein